MLSLSNNKRGSTIFFLLMIGVVFFLLGLALTPAITEASTEATNTGTLNCTAGNNTQTEQAKATCASIDMQQFLFIGTIFGLAGMLLKEGLLR